MQAIYVYQSLITHTHTHTHTDITTNPPPGLTLLCDITILNPGGEWFGISARWLCFRFSSILLQNAYDVVYVKCQSDVVVGFQRSERHTTTTRTYGIARARYP